MMITSKNHEYHHPENPPESFFNRLGLTLRPAKVSDAENIETLTQEAFEQYIQLIRGIPRTMLTDYHQVVKNDCVWVVESHSQLIAVLVLSPRDDHYHITNIAVHPTWQRQGLGSALLSHAEAQSHQADYGEIWLHTNEVMVDNIRLYTAMGYKEIYRLTYHGTASIYMRKSLRQA
ncbi:acetyltransferase [Leptolyngbya sp. PCC 7375]|nr:acetyltransferase [Leptolyngbya sp. PCC 7375]